MFVLVLWGCSPADRRCLVDRLPSLCGTIGRVIFPPSWAQSVSLGPQTETPNHLFLPSRLFPSLPSSPFFLRFLWLRFSQPQTPPLPASAAQGLGCEALHSMPGKMLPLRSWHRAPWTQRPDTAQLLRSLLFPQQAQCSEVHEMDLAAHAFPLFFVEDSILLEKPGFIRSWKKNNLDMTAAQTYNPHTKEVEAGGSEIGRSFPIHSKFEAT